MAPVGGNGIIAKHFSIRLCVCVQKYKHSLLGYVFVCRNINTVCTVVCALLTVEPLTVQQPVASNQSITNQLV